jgi:hypothetical protein
MKITVGGNFIFYVNKFCCGGYLTHYTLYCSFGFWASSAT